MFIIICRKEASQHRLSGKGRSVYGVDPDVMSTLAGYWDGISLKCCIGQYSNISKLNESISMQILYKVNRNMNYIYAMLYKDSLNG